MKYFLLLLACALFHMFSGTDSQQTCGNDSWGNKTVYERYSLPVVLPAGIRTLGVSIPTYKICPVLKGQKVVACDVDVAPTVHILHSDLAIVTRHDSLVEDGSLNVTYYCDYTPIKLSVLAIQHTPSLL